jgi:hypothetical protein
MGLRLRAQKYAASRAKQKNSVVFVPADCGILRLGELFTVGEFLLEARSVAR